MDSHWTSRYALCFFKEQIMTWSGLNDSNKSMHRTESKQLECRTPGQPLRQMENPVQSDQNSSSPLTQATHKLWANALPLTEHTHTYRRCWLLRITWDSNPITFRFRKMWQRYLSLHQETLTMSSESRPMEMTVLFTVLRSFSMIIWTCRCVGP